jgi:glycopeptide antibiotics resistance protein
MEDYAYCILTTFGIEFLQYFMGRSADIDDVITNFLGGLIGYILFLAFNKLLKNTNFWKKFIKNEI